MSFACHGITHCAKCWFPLKDDEFYYCKTCKEEIEKKKEEERFKEAVAKQVQIELAKIQNNIETIEIVNLNGEIKDFTGYWKDDGTFYCIK